MFLPALLAGCGKEQAADVLIEKPDIKIENGMITPEVLEAYGRINEAVPSPDGKDIIFTIAYESIELNKANAEIYKIQVAGGEPIRLTKTTGSESNLRWIEGGRYHSFALIKTLRPLRSLL